MPTPPSNNLGFAGHLPLLDKELRELAAKRRTYITRCAYAIVLFAAGALMMETPISTEDRHGMGALYFNILVGLNLAAVIIVLPPMMLNVIVVDRERGTTDLLSVTAMTPMEIVVQKYISGLIPMFALLLMAMPLLAVTYSFGGVSQSHLWASMYLIFLTTLVVGVLAMTSALERKSITKAVFETYAMLPVPLLLLTPFALVAIWLTHAVRADAPYLPFLLGACGVPPILFTAVYLQRSIRYWQRLPTMHRKQAADDFKRQQIQKWTGQRGLPADRPIAWRERPVNWKAGQKIALVGSVTAAIIVPLALAEFVDRTMGGGEEGYALGIVTVVVWTLLAAFIAMRAGGSVAGERVKQTLDVLLTTPLDGREIVREKLQSLQRIIFLGSLPIVLLNIVGLIFRLDRDSKFYFETGPYFIASLSMLLIYPKLFAWVSLWLGLRSKRPSRAAWNATIVMLIWVLAPVLIVARPVHWLQGYIALLSPGTLLMAAECEMNIFGANPLSVVVGNAVLHLALYLGLRAYVLSRADQLLGRS